MSEAARRQVADLMGAAQRAMSRWDWDTAKKRLDLAADLAGAARLPESGLTLSLHRLRAEVLREQGDPDSAYAVVAPVAARCEELFGRRHPATIRAWAVLGAVLHDRGDLSGARDLYRRVIVCGDRRGRTPASRAVLLSYANLALIYRDRGQQPGALLLLTQVHERMRDRFGDADLDTVRVAAELAELNVDTDLAMARRLLTRAYHTARARLGEAHPMVRRLETRLDRVEPPMPSSPGPGVDGDPEPGRRRIRGRWLRLPARHDRPA